MKASGFEKIKSKIPFFLDCEKFFSFFGWSHIRQSDPADGRLEPSPAPVQAQLLEVFDA